jgi:hypothetical protein
VNVAIARIAPMVPAIAERGHIMGHGAGWVVRRRSRMARNASVLRVLQISLVGAVLASVMGVPMASARNDPFHTYLAPSPFFLDATYCGFPVHADVLVDREYATSSTTSDGDTVLHITGSLTYRLTSPTRSIDLNASGPADVIFGIDDSVTIVGRGTGLQPFTPAQAADTGMPGLALFTGLTVLRFDSIGDAGLVRQRGIVRDVCAWLA